MFISQDILDISPESDILVERQSIISNSSFSSILKNGAHDGLDNFNFNNMSDNRKLFYLGDSGKGKKLNHFHI